MQIPENGRSHRFHFSVRFPNARFSGLELHPRRNSLTRGPQQVEILANIRARQFPPYHGKDQAYEGWRVATGTKHTISGWPYNNVEFSAALLKLSDLIVETNDRDE